jgi:uncharacterized protein (TIGR02996 family)
MNVRRFEHPKKHRFWEVYWEGAAIEVVSGRIGTSGRASELLPDRIAAEIAARLSEGFEEVVPDLVKDQAAPSAEPPAELMARVLEAPDDDQPRMVLADWLQQQGDPRGELIAVQLEAAQTPPGKTVPKRLRDREEHLLAMFRARWLPDATGADVSFVRGFADRVKLEMPVDVALLERVVAASPLLRTLVVAPPKSHWQYVWRVIPLELLQTFSGIFLGGVGIGDEHVAEFAALDLPRLDRLGMRSMTILPSSWKRLAGRTWRALDLHHNNLGKRGVEYLVARDRQTLEALDLGSNEIGDEGLKMLASIPMPALRTLSLKRSKLTPKALPYLERFRQLRVLDISHNNLQDAYVREVLPGVRLTGKKTT